MREVEEEVVDDVSLQVVKKAWDEKWASIDVDGEEKTTVQAGERTGIRISSTHYTLSFVHRFITSQAAVRRKAYWNVLCCKLTEEPFIKRKIVARRNAASEECKDWDWLQPCGIIIQSVFKRNRLDSRYAMCNTLSPSAIE